MDEKLMFPKLQEWLGKYPIKSAVIVGLISSIVGGVIGGYILRFIP